MPLYVYHNTETDEYSEIIQTMSETHEYFGENGDEYSWRRVFTVPNASIDSHIDPFSAKQFADKTRDKKGTFGDLLDRSSELSAARASIVGSPDPIKEKYFDNYSKKRRGAKHPEQMKSFENKLVKVDYTK
jgi:hypothetical protein